MKFNEAKNVKSLALGVLLAIAPLQEANKIDFSSANNNTQEKGKTESQERKNMDRFIYIGKQNGTGSSEIDFLGISHPSSTDFSKPGAIYLDPALINTFFQQLKISNIDPDRVILVVEDVITNQNNTTQEGHSVFITPEMRKLGFKKWIAADTRPNYSNLEVERIHEAGRRLSVLMEKYLKSSTNGERDEYGLPIYHFELDPTTPKNAINEIKDCLQSAVIPSMAFEKNLKNTHDSLTREGYKAIVLAGRQHIISLRTSSLIQAPKADDAKQNDAIMQELHSLLDYTAASHYLAKTLLRYE